MSDLTITQWVIIGTVALWIVWDIIVVWKNSDKIGDAKYHATITRVIQRATMNFPLIPFGAGVVVGHLWW